MKHWNGIDKTSKYPNSRCSTIFYVCNRRNEACLKPGEETCSSDWCYHTTDRRYAFVVEKEVEKYGIQASNGVIFGLELVE